MAYEKFFHFLDALHKKTLSNKVTWESTNVDNIYQVDFSKYSVQVSFVEHGFDEHNFCITIYNNEGNVMESFDDEELTNAGKPESYKVLKEIYETARRQALGTEQALDELLNALQDDDIPF